MIPDRDDRERAAQVELRTLGTLSLRPLSAVDGGNPPNPGGEPDPPEDSDLRRILVQPKRLGLLLYLTIALPRGFHRRDKLLAMFWPELDGTRARGSLRQALHFLRGALPENLLVNRGDQQVGIVAGGIACDAVRFDQALDAGNEEEALALYGGELLPGFHIADCPGFDGWLQLERDRLRRRASRAAALLSHQHAENGEAGEAAKWACAAVDHDPYDETLLRDMMKQLDGLGNRAGALQLYEVQAERLVAELGTGASDETRGLAERLRTGRIADAESPGADANPAKRGVRQPGRPAPVGSAASARALPASRPSGLVPGRVSLEAFHTYQRARHLDGQRTPASVQLALEEYQAAVHLAPDFALAHAGVARSLSILAIYTARPPAETYPRVKHHAARAASIDPSLAEARVWLATAQLAYEWDWAAGEAQLRRAIELDPGCADAYREYGLYLLIPTGRFEEAISAVRVARELEPLSLAGNAYVGAACYFARQYDLAYRELEATLRLDPEFPLAWWFIGMVHEQADSPERAREAFQRAVELTGRSSLMLAQLGRAHAAAGDRRSAGAVLDELDQRGESSGPAAFFTGSIHAALGQPEAAIDWLYRAYRERSPHLLFAGVFPPLDGLRAEGRFQTLLLRLGLR